MTIFRSIQNDKIGNTLVFLAEKIQHLSLTKLLKLLYLIDETAVKKTGVPLTWLDYRVWALGPVAYSIYNEIKYGNKETVNGKVISLDNFVKIWKKQSTKRGNSEEIYINALVQFKDDEFSDFEIDTINEVVSKYGHLSSKELIHILHKQDTLWHKIVEKNELKKAFETFKNTSTYIIPLQELNNGDALKEMALKSAYESLDLQLKLNEPEYEHFD